MGQGAFDADQAEAGRQARASFDAHIGHIGGDLFTRVRSRYERGYHTLADGTKIPLRCMTDKHLKNSIARAKTVEGPFWAIALPYLLTEKAKRTRKPTHSAEGGSK